MIGALPQSLEVNGTAYPIRTDYRVALTVIEAFGDNNLTAEEKAIIAIECLFQCGIAGIPQKDIEEAYNQAIWFLNRGDTIEEPRAQAKVYDFEQDEQIIFSAINKVAGKEVRECEYMHFWTFMGLFSEIGEGTFATIVSIRDKKAKGKKLDKWELDYYKTHKSTIDLKKTYTDEEEAERDAVRILLGIEPKKGG